MSNNIANVPVRSINDLSLLTYIPLNTEALKNIKIPIGNVPLGFFGESISLEQLAQITPPNMQVLSKIAEASTQVEVEKNRAMVEEGKLRKEIASAQGGVYSFNTMADFNNLSSTIPANSSVRIAQGEDAGLYSWDGVTLTKAVGDTIELIKKVSQEQDKKLLNLFNSTEKTYPINKGGYYTAFDNSRPNDIQKSIFYSSIEYLSSEAIPVNIGDIVSWQGANGYSGIYYSSATLNIYNNNSEILKSIDPYREVGNHANTGDYDSANWIPNKEILITEDGFVTLTVSQTTANSDVFLKVNKTTAITKHVVETLKKEYPFREKIIFKDARQFSFLSTNPPAGATTWDLLNTEEIKGSALVPVKKGDLIQGVLAIQSGIVGASSIQYAVFNTEQKLVRAIQGNKLKNMSGFLEPIEIVAEQDGYIYLATDFSNYLRSNLYVYRTHDNSLYQPMQDVVDYYASKNAYINDTIFANNNPTYSDLGELTPQMFTYLSTPKIGVKKGDVFEIKTYPVALNRTISETKFDSEGVAYVKNHNVSLITLFDEKGLFLSSLLKTSDFDNIANADAIYKSVTINQDGYIHVSSSNNVVLDGGRPYLRKKTDTGLEKAIREAVYLPQLEKEFLVHDISFTALKEGFFGTITGSELAIPNGCISEKLAVKAGDLVIGQYYSEEASTTWFNPLIFFNKKGDFIKTLVTNTEITMGAAEIYDFLKLKTVITEDGFVQFSSINKTPETNKNIFFKVIRNAGQGFLNANKIKDHLVDIIESETKDGKTQNRFYKGLGRTFDNWLLGADMFSGTKKIPVKIGDIIDISVAIEPYQTVSQTIINAYDQNGLYLKNIDRAANHYQNTSNILESNYTMDFNGFITVTNAFYTNANFTPSVVNRSEKVNKQITTVLAEKLKGVFSSGSGSLTQRTDALYSLPTPTDLIRVDLTGSHIPNSKAEGSINGTVTFTIGGASVKLDTQYGVQGDSSAGYPKKNLSFDLFTDKTYKNDALVKIGGLLPHPTLVYKANWVDNTHVRNITANQIYEQMIQTRKMFPKRASDQVMTATGDITKNMFTGALSHPVGYPCIFYHNGIFYGMGTLNIHKRRENYNLDKDIKKNIQLDPINSYTQFSGDFNNTVAWSEGEVQHTINETWEVRNPKLKGYKAGDKITDTTVLNAIQRLWTFNGTDDNNIRNNFDKFYRKIEVIDTYLVIQYFGLADLLNKNTLWTTWDGNVWSPLAFDLDSICGLAPWDGASIYYPTNWVPYGFLHKLATIILPDVTKRYVELRKAKVLELDNFIKLTQENHSKFYKDLFKQEIAKWADVPSRELGGLNQMYNWLQARIAYMDALYGFVDSEMGVIGQKMWNPPTLAAKTTQTTTVSVPDLAVGTKVTALFSGPMLGTTMVAEVKTVGVVTISHNNPTDAEVNLDTYSLQIFLT